LEIILPFLPTCTQLLERKVKLKRNQRTIKPIGAGSGDKTIQPKKKARFDRSIPGSFSILSLGIVTYK